MKPFDLLIMAMAAAVIIFISFQVYTGGDGSPVVRIETSTGNYIYPLDEDREIDLEGPVGHSQIVIKDGKAYFSCSDCQDKLCVLMGSISEPGQWVACLPNRIFISIEGEKDEEIDVLSY